MPHRGVILPCIQSPKALSKICRRGGRFKGSGGRKFSPGDDTAAGGGRLVTRPRTAKASNCAISKRLAARPLPVYRNEKRLRIAFEFQFRLLIKTAGELPCQDKKGPAPAGRTLFYLRT